MPKPPAYLKRVVSKAALAKGIYGGSKPRAPIFPGARYVEPISFEINCNIKWGYISNYAYVRTELLSWLDRLGTYAKKLFNQTTKTWDKKPVFKADKKFLRRTVGEAGISVYTNDLVYYLINFGTQPHDIPKSLPSPGDPGFEDALLRGLIEKRTVVTRGGQTKEKFVDKRKRLMFPLKGGPNIPPGTKSGAKTSPGKLESWPVQISTDNFFFATSVRNWVRPRYFTTVVVKEVYKKQQAEMQSVVDRGLMKERISLEKQQALQAMSKAL